MKVKELIKILKQCDENAQVLLEYDYYDRLLDEEQYEHNEITKVLTFPEYHSINLYCYQEDLDEGYADKIFK